MIPAGQLEYFCQFILDLRVWERSNAPLFTPQIGLDVLLYATACALEGNPACAKDFHLVLSVSKDRVREVTRVLERDGLIISEVDANDTRLKRLHPTAAGQEVVRDYMSQFLRGFRPFKSLET